MITAGYGLPNRTLGAVSVIGPMRMDYARAIMAVRGAAAALSAYVEDVYEELPWHLEEQAEQAIRERRIKWPEWKE